jgi:hypothetical protein
MRYAIILFVLSSILGCSEETPTVKYREVKFEVFANKDFVVSYSNESGGVEQTSRSGGNRFRITQNFKVGNEYAVAVATTELANIEINAWADGFPNR